jgi:hypothetical protein
MGMGVELCNGVVLLPGGVRTGFAGHYGSTLVTSDNCILLAAVEPPPPPPSSMSGADLVKRSRVRFLFRPLLLGADLVLAAGCQIDRLYRMSVHIMEGWMAESLAQPG